MMTSYRFEPEAEEIPSCGFVATPRLPRCWNPEWRHCVCSSSALRSAAPICKPAPNSSDRQLSIDDTMPSLVEVTVNVSGPGLYITLPLVLRSARPREEVTRFPGRDSPWRGSKLQAAPIASKVMKFLLPQMMNYRGLPSSSPFRHCPETECLKRLESPWLDGRDLISWHGRYSWVVPAEGSESNCTVVPQSI